VQSVSGMGRLLMFLSALALFVFFQFFWGYPFLESFSIGMSLYFILDFVDKIGRRLVILDVIVILAVVTWLLFPILAYHFFTKENPLVYMWRRYMPISSEEYFSYVLPGTLAMILGLRFPRFRNRGEDHKHYIVSLREYLKGRSKTGITLFAIGFAASMTIRLATGNPGFLFILLSYLTYVGAFYIYFSDFKFKKITLLVVFLLTLAQSISTGMFGTLIFISALAAIILLLNTQLSFWRKLIFFLVGCYFVIVLQSMKVDFRSKAWKDKEGNVGAAFFTELFWEHLKDPSTIFNDKGLFYLHYRLNQGWLIAKTMYWVPARADYDYGNSIALAVSSSFVPRVLWPDKPESGGIYNMKRFAGIRLVGYSMNISPIGEGYGNFGVVGGIIYMFFYGFFLNWVFTVVLRLVRRTPSILVWIPTLFLEAVVVETDTLQAINSIVKSALFILIIYWVADKFFKTKI